MAADSRFVLILEVAVTLKQPFTHEDLVVACWKHYPSQFSMAEYPYPDNNKISALIYGCRGLLGCGALEKIGPKVYRITEEGRKVIA